MRAILSIVADDDSNATLEKTLQVSNFMKDPFHYISKEAVMYHKVRTCAAPIISFCTVLVIIVSVCCISGCMSSKGKDDAKFTSSTHDTTASDTITPGTAAATTAAPTLSWDAPATYTDGSALLDLKEYRVYFSNSPSPYSTGHYYPVSAPITSVKVKDVITLETGTYYFVVTAVNSTNRESDPSNVAIKYLY